jgi:hypothetical protein
MKAALILLTVLAFNVCRANPICYDADSDAFVDSSVVPLSRFYENVPEIGLKADGAPQPVTWSKLDSTTTSKSEIIGYHNQAAIIRVIYTSKAPDGQTDIYSAAFAYQVIVPDTEMSAFPFFIISGGEQLSGVESQFVSTDSLPFSLQIQMTMKGNGVFWSMWNYRFGKRGPILLERTDGGRKLKETTKKYKQK